MLRSCLTAGLVLAVALSWTSSASAQFGRGFRIPPSAQNIMLLRSEAVQKELGLNDDQTNAIGDLAMQMQSDAIEILSGLQDLSEEERKEEMPNIIKMINEKGKELQGEVDKLLKPEQTKRMKELSLQRRDVSALEDEEVIAALALTDDQKSKLQTIRDEASDKQEELVKEALSGGGDRQAMRGKMEEIQKDTSKKALAVLTAEQREKFEKLKGPKFDFPPQRGGFGF